MKKIKNFIERKSLLYKTKVEYGDYTINHVQGCAHGCRYPCYAYLLSKRFGKSKTIEDWMEPKLVKNYMKILEKEVPKLKEKIKWVHLCFTTDPFMFNYPEVKEASLEIIRFLNDNDIKCSALSKGVLPIELANFNKENEFGITLISLDEKFREEVEPGAAPYELRIKHLKALSDLGVKTWVSIEPYPTPNILDQDFFKILEKISFVDKIIFGRLNYNKRVAEYKEYKKYYNNLSEQVIDFCEKRNIEFHIKDGTIRK